MAITSSFSRSRTDISQRTLPAEARDQDPQFATFGGTAGDDTLVGTKFDDVISGADGDDLLVGRGGHDSIDGGAQADVLEGGHGRDTLFGSNGDDRIIGGVGADSLAGGANRNIFVYGRELDSIPAEADIISDFRNNERLDMSAVDAVRGGMSNEAFTYIGAADFTAPGQLRAVQVGTDTLIQANTVGARGAEMEILIEDFDAFRLNAGHFVL